MKGIIIIMFLLLVTSISCISIGCYQVNQKEKYTDGYSDPNKMVYSIVVKDVNGIEYTIYTNGSAFCYIKEKVK